MPEPAFVRKNIEALKGRYPGIAKRLEDRSRKERRLRIVRSSSGAPNLVAPRDGRFLMLYDPDEPIVQCRNYLDSLQIKFAPIVVFLGLGLGYHLSLFLRHYAERLGVRKVVVFEEDMDMLHFALRHVDLHEIITHPDVQLFIGEDVESAHLTLRRDVVMDKGVQNFMRGTRVIPLPVHIRLSPDYYRRAVQVTKRSFAQMMILAGNDPIDSFLGMDNLLMNIPHIVSNPGINLLFKRFRGKPAVTVASGPSLNKNIHLLKELRERALIVCCDASFLPLMKRGIRPHLVVGFERTDGSEFFYEGIPDFDGVYLAVCPLVRPRTFDSFKGKKIIAQRAFSHFDWLHQDKGTLSIGPCVGNMAYKVAEVLGCDPIIMIGQDLAFASDGDTHVKDMPFGERDEFYHEKVLEVEGNDGRPIKTSKAWDVFRIAFEEDIRGNPGTTINATEGGAKIRGAKVMTFREAIDRYCREDFFPLSTIDDAVSGFQDALDIPAEYGRFHTRVQGTHEKLASLLQRFREMMTETRKVQREFLLPFIREGKAFDRAPLEAITVRFLKLLEEYLNDPDVRDIMLHTVQPHSLWFSNKFNILPDLYDDPDMLLAAQVMMIRDWLGVVGQLFISTADALTKAGSMLTKELEKGAYAS